MVSTLFNLYLTVILAVPAEIASTSHNPLLSAEATRTLLFEDS